jgi:iron complex outermembrane receptor protein
VGGSYAWDKGYLGVAGSGYNTRYGTIGEPEVTIGMQQRRLDVAGDYVEATDQTNNDPLPRITPGRIGGALIYSERGFEARLEVLHAFEQDRTSPFELHTDAYTSLNAGLYTRAVGPLTCEVYVKGSNLLDEEIRLATSFLKDVAPLPGRSVSVGVVFSF